VAPPRSIKSAERTLALFELFSLEERGLTVGAITRQLEMPQPSVTMLLKNLHALGYLEYNRVDRTYIPTVRVALLGSWMHRRFTQGLQLEHRLSGIRHRVGESSFIAIQNGASSQYIVAITALHPDRMEVQSGQFRPITCTAVGRALLSLKSNAEIVALAQRCNSEVSEDRLRVNLRTFVDVIDRVRRQGYAETAGDSKLGSGAFAVTAPAPVGNMPIAVGVGGRIENLQEKREQILAELFELRACLLEGIPETPATQVS
jgi:DNA-binding IclR family transcriptional regulator